MSRRSLALGFHREEALSHRQGLWVTGAEESSSEWPGCWVDHDLDG